MQLEIRKFLHEPTLVCYIITYSMEQSPMNLQEVGGGWEDWMVLAQHRDRWRALVSTVMNIRISKMRGIS